jgi:glycosyltransferase involved in cell wall biosynthesis
MKITIGYITAREQPRLNWLIDGLEQQAQARDKIELIVVDALGRPAQTIGYRPIKAITKLIETRPKPSIWQGPHRITAHDFFANANARNTAIVLCSTDYICFLDDRCRLDPGWLDQVRRGEKKRASVICGPYDKQEDRGVSVDHRRQHAPQGKQNCGGRWCYGGNFALPLKWLVEVNGCEEGCDPVGLEDCALGHMLENVGRQIDFVVEMSVQQDRRGFVHPLNFPRQDKGQSPNDKSHALQDRFFPRKRTEFTPDLKKLRKLIDKDKPFPIPEPSGDPRDWYDGSPIRGVGLTVEERATRARGLGEFEISGQPRLGDTER